MRSKNCKIETVFTNNFVHDATYFEPRQDLFLIPSEMAEEDNEVAETEVLAVSKEKQKEAKAMFQILLFQHSGINIDYTAFVSRV